MRLCWKSRRWEWRWVRGQFVSSLACELTTCTSEGKGVWMFPRPIPAPHSSLGSFHQGKAEATHCVLGEEEVLAL